MRRLVLVLLAGVPTLGAAQGFGVYEHGTCTMGRGGVAAAQPCADASAIFFNPAGLAGLAGGHATAGATLIQAVGSFTDDQFARQTDLDNPLIPAPSAYFSYAVGPKATVGLGVYVPYGLETRWPTSDFDGRFLGYNSKIQSIYVQPTVGYQIHERVKVGLGVAYIHSSLELNQRVDLSAQAVPGAGGATFYNLGIPFGTDIVDAQLSGSGSGFAINFGAIIQLTDQLSIGGHWLTRKTISYEGDATFAQIPTGLVLPAGHPIDLAPICSPSSPCPVDNLVGAQFLPSPTSPFVDGGVQTEITMPPQGSLGIAYQVNDAWTLMADWHYVVWGWFATLPVDFEHPGTPDFALYEGYSDTHGVRVGAEFRQSDRLTLRAGAIHHTGAAPDETVTPLLPEGKRSEVALGLTARLSPQLVADVAYQYVKQNDRRGRVHDPSVGNTGIYKFGAHLFGVGLSLTF